MKQTKLNIDNRTIIRVLVLATLFWLGMRVVYSIRGALVWLLIAGFLALALNPPVSYLSKRIPGGSRGLATGIAYVVVLSLLGIFIYFTAPPLFRETRNLAQTIPQRVEQLHDSSQDGILADFIEQYNLQEEAEELASNLASSVGDASGQIVTGVGRVGSSLIGFITVLVLTFLMLVEGPNWSRLFWSYVPASSRQRNQKLAQRMYRVVTGYVNGQLVIAILSGLASLVAMVLVGLPNALALAGVVALTALVPMIGATIGAIIVVIVALFQSTTQAVLLAVFFIVYQQIENNVVQPYIQSRALEISPLLVLVAVVCGFQLGGLLGGFLAIPVAACLKILAVEYAGDWQKRFRKEPV